MKVVVMFLAGPLAVISNYARSSAANASSTSTTVIRARRLGRCFERSGDVVCCSGASQKAQSKCVIRPVEKCASNMDPARLQRRCSVVVGPSEVESHSNEAGAASS